MRVIDEVFNKTEPRQLTRGGIRYENEIFHEPDITSGLRQDLYGFGVQSFTTINKNQSISFTVRVAPLPEGDVSAIRVYNYARKTYLYIPNADPAKRGTYATQKVNRIANNRANEDFFKAGNVDINRANVLTKLAPHPQTITPATPAMDGGSSPHHIAIHDAEKPMIIRKGVQRGAATRKTNAAEAKRKAKAKAKAKAEQIKLLDQMDGKEVVEMFDPIDARANTAISTPRQRFTAEDKAALRAAMKLKLELPG
jgi:hypothetical protein